MTEEHGVPDHCCGFEVSLDKVDDWKDDTHRWSKTTEVIRCCRETWNKTEHCIWHAEVNDKPIKELKAARADGPERLDEAYLVGVEADSDLSFRGCGLKSAVFSKGRFTIVDFCDADLSNAKFHNASLPGTNFYDAALSNAKFHNAFFFSTLFTNAVLNNSEFHNADLSEAKFHDATLISAEFHDADLFNVQFHNCDLSIANFHGVDSSDVEFHDADLSAGSFHDATLINAEFHDADLSNAQFHDAVLFDAQLLHTNLTNVEFRGADLSSADCTDANAQDTNFMYATLHDTLLTRTDCRGATFTSALLYETVFADTRINSQTTFHDPESTFYDSITSRPAVVYEENPHTSKNLPEDTHPLKAAEWVYRRLEKLHEENALSEDVRGFHISKEEARRKSQYELREYARYTVSTLQWYVTGHGESILRIFRSAAFLILACGILYPFAGGFESSSTGTVYRLHPFSVELSRAAISDTIATVLQSIYFSVITFTTIGYGDLYPTGAWSKVLVGFESLSGAILIALFVFVLGRRVAR